MGNIKLDAYKLISLDKIPSTQNYALQLIADGTATNKTVIVATAQTMGRGRYRRSWVSHTGNLYASFIFKIYERNPKLSYTMAVAVAETLISFGIKPQIKWPNDILVDDKKISGILIEYAQNFVIIGIGINVKTCPTVKEYQTTKVNDYASASVEDVFGVLMKKIDKWYDADFCVVKNRWMELATRINKIITYHGKPMELIGLNDDGALVLRDDTEYILTYSDEISL
ncbi:MAG: biotin--[acetyl-CoA-carboxylase] ligase [Alphaproteobacteria bacterium]|nr:biotin--[acetyl-CoA-carboxylase] ligase [Alphaproteobacteria bacterium]